LVAVLEWLWDVVAGPVLDRLGFSGPSPDDGSWPRVWWCTSGLLSFVPIHAAGHHHTRDDPVPATVIDRVISSYTPTIRALAHARRSGPQDRSHRSTAGTGDRSVVVVAMPHTPQATDLPGALAEATLLKQRFPYQVTVLTGPQDATHQTVLGALPGARWAHFACHGSSDLTNPSASHLLLNDHQQQPLTVVDVSRQRLQHAGLAFLSACSTARPGRLTDEAIHLASAFQLAGYRHVIATLWPIDDLDAVTLADDVYRQLPGPAHATFDAAAALHNATRRLRERSTPTPSIWASHIHTGA
jgi:CHAT domain-containing protein